VERTKEGNSRKAERRGRGEKKGVECEKLPQITVLDHKKFASNKGMEGKREGGGARKGIGVGWCLADGEAH